jgi:hypothetical protein
VPGEQASSARQHTAAASNRLIVAPVRRLQDRTCGTVGSPCLLGCPRCRGRGREHAYRARARRRALRSPPWGAWSHNRRVNPDTAQHRHAGHGTSPGGA